MLNSVPLSFIPLTSATFDIHSYLAHSNQLSLSCIGVDCVSDVSKRLAPCHM